MQINKYQIIEEIGRGGMGLVYKAFDPQMNKFIALKIILSDDENQVKRFMIEAKAMAKMRHPSIVQIYMIGKHNARPFIAMEYITGHSLREFLDNAALNIRSFSQIMAKIAKAIAYAHKKGVIHRDLKPGNIMLDEKEEPYVMDFGLAKLTKTDNSISKTGIILGTPKYMSPQQAKGEHVNELTDIYALGAIFYEMLAGKSLIDGENITDILFAAVHKESPLLRQMNSQLAVDLEAICYKATAKEKDKRYQSAQELSNDIENFLDGKFIKAKAPSAWQRFYYKTCRYKLALLALVISCLLLFTSIWVFKNYQTQETHTLLMQAKELQEKASLEKAISKKIKVYLKIDNLLEKALLLSSKNIIKKKLVKIKQMMGILAKEEIFIYL